MKKILALILVLVMVLSIAPLGVLAQEGTEEEKTPAEELFTLESAEEQVQTPQAEEPEVKALAETPPADLQEAPAEKPKDEDPVGEPTDGDDNLPLLGGGPATYTVTYDANGGTGTVTDTNSPYEENATVTVLANGFTAPTGKKFVSWNTVADGSGTSYSLNGTFTITSNTTLYAIWEEISYTVEFVTKGDATKSSQTVNYSKEIDLSYSGTRKGYASFAGWSTTNGGTVVYSVDATPSKLTETDGATVTLYGVWIPKTLTITFVGNGGQTKDKAPEYTQTFDYDGAATLTANQFTKSYFKFVEWKDENGNTYANKALFDPNELIEKGVTTLTLTAQWEMRQYNITVKFYLYSEKNGKYVHTTKDVGSGYATFEHILAKDIKDGTQIPFNYASFPPEKTFYFTAKDGYTLAYIEKTKTGQYPVTSTDGTLTVSSMEDTVGCTIKVYFKVSKSSGGGVGAALTGDDFGTWVALAGISLLGATGTGIMYKKRRREQ